MWSDQFPYLAQVCDPVCVFLVHSVCLWQQAVLDADVEVAIGPDVDDCVGHGGQLRDGEDIMSDTMLERVQL